MCEIPPLEDMTSDAGSIARAELTTDRGVSGSGSWGTAVRRWLAHRALRLLMLLYHLAIVITSITASRRRRRKAGQPLDILITGTFYSDNWVRAHLGPLTASRNCRRVRMVATAPVPPMPGVEAIYPPQWLQNIAGKVPARLITFLIAGLRERPDIVAGFHLLVNGLMALLLARLVGARSMYFCVGGPKEVLGGGVRAENRIFGRMGTADPVVERRLLRAVSRFDYIITMGTRAVAFFRHHGIDTGFHVVSGGIDDAEFGLSEGETSSDLILVGRLAEIKRIDVFLEMVKIVVDRLPDLVATVVGDGELRESLERQARDLGIDRNVRFVGHQKNVGHWLRQSKVFVLTSDSEGLALSLMEAMMCGRPAVVSNVGDLADLVEDGVNGYLVPRRSPEVFASRIVDLLTDDLKLTSFSQEARKAALRYETSSTARRWDNILRTLPADSGA